MPAPGVDAIPIASREQWLALRRSDVTASDVAAVCGHGLFGSPAKVWAEKRGLIPPAEETAAMQRGRWGEAAVFEALADVRPDLELRRAKVYLRDPAARLGATPDGVAIEPDRPGLVVVQAKVVMAPVFRRDWLADPAADPHDTDADATAPLAYQLQTLTEIMLAGADRGLLAALVVDTYRWTLRSFPIARHVDAEAMIRERVAAFWRDFLDPGVMPAIDPAMDAALVKAVYPVDDGSTIDLSGDNRIGSLVDEWREAAARRRDTEAMVDVYKTEIAAKMGAATFATLADGRILTNKLQHRAAHEVKASSFRVLRLKQV